MQAEEEQRFSRIDLAWRWNSSASRRYCYRTAGAPYLTELYGADIGIMLIIAVMFTAFVAGLNPACSRPMGQSLAAVLAGLGPSPPPQPHTSPFPPDVLLVSPRQADWISVIGTLEPRGVRVLLADGIAAGLGRIHGAGGGVGMLIVDGSLPGGERLVREARRRFPNVEVFTLDGARPPARIATTLMDYASW
jgi:hypothetical protein